jgi:hypothetical protein
MNENDIQSHSPSWLFFVKASFAISMLSIAIGILLMPAVLMVKAYFALGSLFLVSATFTMAKTMRDEHESQRLIKKISDAKTSKIIQEFTD